MIAPEILESVRRGTCAIGYMTIGLEAFIKDLTKPYFKVVGTGFLVRPTTVMTNRHVVEGLIEAQNEFGVPDEQRVAHFTYVREGRRLGIAWQRITAIGTMHTGEPHPDVAFVEFNPPPKDNDFKQCKRLGLGQLSKISVGQPIAACGYPYGTSVLRKGERGKIYRFGPVLQQGFISAIAPYDGGFRYEDLLLDLRIAAGMSGSPVFLPEDGLVIGMIHSAWEATTAVAVPIEQKLVNAWLDLHDKATQAGTGVPVSAVIDDRVR